MPKSKNRKNHKAKVAQRKRKIDGMKKQYEKFYSDVMMKQLEMLKEKYQQMSGETENEVEQTEE